MNRVAFGEFGGRTSITSSLIRQPLSVSRAFYLDDEDPSAATVYLQSTSGVLLASDRVCLSIGAAHGARVGVRGETSTVVHGGNRVTCAEQHVEVVGGNGTRIDYLPSPTVVLDQAAFVNSLTVRLSGGAIAIVADGISAHRAGTGPEPGTVRSTIDVIVDGIHVWRDRAVISPETLISQGTVAIVGCCDDELERAVASANWPQTARVGVGQLPSSAGIVVRCTAQNADAVRSVQRIAALIFKEYLRSVQ